MLGALVGGDSCEERVYSARETVKRPVDGEYESVCVCIC